MTTAAEAVHRRCRVSGCVDFPAWATLRAALALRANLPDEPLDRAAELVDAAALFLCRAHLEQFHASPEAPRVHAALADFVTRLAREGGAR